MKLRRNWRTGKATSRKKKIVLKPKIPWEKLGLTDPSEEELPQSIYDIRREISSIASQSLRPNSFSRSNEKDTHSPSCAEGRLSSRKRRRGATEEP